MPDCPPLILELVERFTLNKDRYLSPNYNEEQMRHEFLNPMFEILGWDMTNKKGFSDAYKEVLYEESIKAGAPDYSFRIGGHRKFFVEAKAPHVNIATDSRSAAQLRSYAWSAKLSLSILTDFANFAVYDGRIPVRSELPPPGEARVLLIPHTEYPARWNEIESIFSQQAIGRGLYDRFADSNTPKRGTAPVDEEFLNQISHWRDRLASSLREANPALAAPELNFAVQMIIDRIVFLRIAEDRGLETYGQLQTIAKVHNIFGELLHLFQAADTRYNSGLFHFRAEPDRSSLPDDLTPNLDISDAVLQDIITGLYPPRSHYRFSHVPSEILGQVYEQFLGKIIVLTPKRARVQDKPQVRKAGGVYYTPSYIVQYIVDNTLGKLLENKTPDDAAELKVLDPACGSGSFLLGAYQKLLDWHLDFYYHHDPDKLARGKNPPIRQIAAPASSGLFESKPSYRLTIAERKRILLSNIFGVDIDTQAVEVTKLSLLLKCLEDETAESIQSLLKFMRKRALPDLDDNIKCGNSLIAPDFYDPAKFPDNQNLTDGEKRHINAFDWKQGFPKIMKAGGFDAVIGNPPYLFITELDDAQKRYYGTAYETCQYRFDVYGLFAEKSIRQQLRPDGLLSFIIPHTLLSNDSFEKLRRLFLAQMQLVRILDIGPGVFSGARNETMIFVARKPASVDAVRTCPVIHTTARTFPAPAREFHVDPQSWTTNPRAAWVVRQSPAQTILISRITQANTSLGDICTINQGLRTGNNDRYLSPKRKTALWKHAAGGKNVGRYEPLRNGLYVYYKPEVLDAPRSSDIFESRAKIVVQEIRNITLRRRIVATYDNRRFYCLQSTNVINFKPFAKPHWPILYVLGILNSTFTNFYFRQCFPGNNHIASNQLAQIPLVSPAPVPAQTMITLVTRILAAHRKLAVAKLPSERTRLQREIAATDSQIDALVYKLHNLTLDEIALVESASS